MSGHHIAKYGHQRTLSRGHSKDFTVATPEEFVKRFGGDRVINKVCSTNWYAGVGVEGLQVVKAIKLKPGILI